MKTFTESLAYELTSKLELLDADGNSPISHAEEAINLIKECLDKLRFFIKTNSFSSKVEEIEFFKILKPQISSQLIYFNEIYNIEVAKPVGNAKIINKYYEDEAHKLKKYYLQHKDFYKYYRTHNTSLDKKYFLRRKHDVKLLLDSHFFEVDYEFTTVHDFTVAKILANDKIQKFLDSQKINFGRGSAKKQVINSVESNLKWTGSKVALVELLYAIHASDVINNGELSLNAMAQKAEQIFNIKLGQFHRIYLEIKNRKTIDQTSFINKLKTNLEKRIEEAEK